MTEFELTETLYNIYGSMSDNASMYFALVSAYLVASYVAGDKFTTRQLAIINTLFVVWTLGIVFGMFTSMRVA